MASTTDAPETRSSHRDMDDVRDELLGMLGRVGQAPPPPQRAEPAESEAEPAAATPKPASKKSPEPEANEADSPYADDPNVTCVKCGNTKSWGTASWCPNCGYYPSLAHDGEAPEEESDGLENLTFFDICPPWAIQIAVGVVAILGLSAVMEHALDGNLGWLSLASLVQLSFGGVIVLFAHKQAIMMGLNDPDCPSAVAAVTYPPAVWMPVLRNLKERAHLLVTVSWGLIACLSALMVYGPIHMDEIKKELAETRKDRKPLMGRMIGTMAKVAAATNGPGTSGPDLNLGEEGSLEDAIGGFAGLATEQGGLGDIANGLQTGNVDAAIRQAEASGIGGTGSLDLNLNGGGSQVGGSMEDAIGNLAGMATGQAGLDDPEELQKVIAGGIMADAAGAGGIGTPPTGGVVRAGTSPDDSARNGRPISVAANSGPRSSRPRSTGRSTGASGGTAPITKPDNSLDAIVFGYLISAGGEIRSLLIATTGPNGRPRYAGKLSSDALTASQWAELKAELPNIRTRRPLVACPNAGHWVEPKFVLTIGYQRWLSIGPQDAQVQSITTR